MTQGQISAKDAVRDKYSRILAAIYVALYGRGSSMDRTFRYLSSHGFMALALLQPYYKALRLMREFTFTGTAVFSFYLVPFPIKLRLNGTRIVLSVKFAPGAQIPFFTSDIASWKRARWITIGILVSSWVLFWLTIMSASTAIVNLPAKVAMTAFRCWSTTLTSAFRSVPILIAALVIIFTTGDAWRLYGNESAVRFEILTVTIIAIGIAAMVIAVAQLEGGWRQVADRAGESPEELTELARKTPARDLVIQGVVPMEDTDIWYVKWVRRNVRLMFWFTLVSNFFSVAFITFIIFIFIGMVAVSAGATRSLLQSHSIDIIWTWTFLGQSFVMTRPLLLLSILFGCVAALTFATASLQDERSLKRFMQLALLSHRRSLSALAYYFGAIVGIQEQLSWQAVSSELQASNRTAILDVFRTVVEQAPPQIISMVFDMARNRNLGGWAGSQGLAILDEISDRKFARISAESRNFVLASAAANQAGAAVIESINRRIERMSPSTIN